MKKKMLLPILMVWLSTYATALRLVQQGNCQQNTVGIKVTEALKLEILKNLTFSLVWISGHESHNLTFNAIFVVWFCTTANFGE